MATLKIGELRVRMEGRVNREKAGVYHPSNPCAQERQRRHKHEKGIPKQKYIQRGHQRVGCVQCYQHVGAVQVSSIITR